MIGDGAGRAARERRDLAVGEDRGVASGPPESDGQAAELAARRSAPVSVCIPARDEEATVGHVVASVRRHLTAAGGGADVVDEIVVVDDGSADATAGRARDAGATVVTTEPGDGGGKGRAMARGLAHSSGELVVFLDADVENFGPHFVTALLAPLVDDPAVVLVKGYYDRPLHGAPTGGGRVTELVARPVIDLLFPELAHIRQPLAGETALRRMALAGITLEPGYGVELGLLVDVAERFGTAALAQADLGRRVHRNRPLDELRPQATDVLRAALARAGAALHR